MDQCTLGFRRQKVGRDLRISQPEAWFQAELADRVSLQLDSSKRCNLDTGRDWGQEEKVTTENEVVGWHH